jgi:hypothetical protein
MTRAQIHRLDFVEHVSFVGQKGADLLIAREFGEAFQSPSAIHHLNCQLSVRTVCAREVGVPKGLGRLKMFLKARLT